MQEPTKMLIAPAALPVAAPEATMRLPLAPLVVTPELTIIEPDTPVSDTAPDATLTAPEPVADAPENSDKAPEVPVDTPVIRIAAPDFAVPATLPELKIISPLAPPVTAFALRIVTAPLDDDVPPPLTMRTSPPEAVVDDVVPAARLKCPPTPEFVLPMTTLSEPAAPLSAAPVAITTLPAAPDAVVPVLSVMLPDVVLTVDEPVRRSREPVPAVPSPLDRMMAPVEPAALPAAMPDAMVTGPDCPVDAVPELNNIAPVLPAEGALAERMTTAPDVPDDGAPLSIDVRPAVPWAPPSTMTWPTPAEFVLPTTTEMEPAGEPPTVAPICTINEPVPVAVLSPVPIVSEPEEPTLDTEPVAT